MINRRGLHGRLIEIDGDTAIVASLEYPDLPGVRFNRWIERMPLDGLVEARGPVFLAMPDGSTWEAPAEITIPRA